jgi:peptidoglycan hydrolase CwlO-like protein
VVTVSATVLAATIGVLAWKKYKGLQEEKEELQTSHEELQTKHEGLLSMAADMAVQLAELAAENDYLKSATGAAKTLKSYDC